MEKQMAKKKSEGEEVRLAFDGPSLDQDELITHIEARNREDQSRSSSAGESRQKIGTFLDDTGMNSQAYSWCRSILKKPDTQKAMDIILSLETALPMVKAHVTGRNTIDMFAGAIEPATALPKPTYDATFDPADNDEMLADDDEPSWQEERQVQNEAEDEIAAEADDFDTHLASAAE